MESRQIMRRRVAILRQWTLLALCLAVVLTPHKSLSEKVELQGDDRAGDLSLKNETQHAIKRGLTWLKTQQHADGYWSQPDYPALTALVLTAFMGEPNGESKATTPPFIEKGYEYLLRCVQPDGGIYVKDLANYNTAVSMTALVVANNPSYEPTLRAARNSLAGFQGDFGEEGKTDSPYDGGIGYGSHYDHSDMSNTTFALEALYYTRHLEQDDPSKDLEIRKLNWPAALKFIERCQNLTSHNDQPWASDDPENKGGFVYYPGASHAGEIKLESGKTALRSYGSVSYAGLLSYIYAEMDRNDPRVTAVLEWLQRNYTLEENPGMGAQGLFYYYHMMAKALSSYGVSTLVLEGGKKVEWRKELSLKLMNLQKPEGFWVNENARWWEMDPVLATSYAVITLEILCRGL